MLIPLLPAFLFAFMGIGFLHASSPLEDYNLRITEHTLKNGIHFILLQDHTAPAVSFHVHVKAGSVNETPGETGISHLIEHLAFNGTRNTGTTNWPAEKRLIEKTDRAYERLRQTAKRNADKTALGKLYEEFLSLNRQANACAETNEFGKILDRHGAIGPNAYCSYDMTAYWVELPSNKTELWAALESDRLFNPVFRGFYEELEVVKEERRMRVDNSPWGRLMEEFSGVAYRLHPYRHPIVGYAGDLEEMTRSKVRKFYEKYYLPSNIVVAVAGDVYPEDFIPLAERYFGSIPAGRPYDASLPGEPASTSEKKVVVRMDSQPILLTGFNIQDIRHPDIPALEICAEILGGGRTSRLYRKLVKEEKTAVSTGSWCWAPQHPGIFYIWAIASKGTSNSRLEEAIFEEVEKMKSAGIQENEISGARARLRMNILTSLKSRRGMARELAWYEAVTGDWRNLFIYAGRLEEVTAEDISRVMKKYFSPENMTTGMVEPNAKE